MFIHSACSGGRARPGREVRGVVCERCCGALLHSGVRHLVFGSTMQALLKNAPPYPYLESQRVFELLGVEVKVERLDLEAEVLAAHTGYWKK